MFKSKVVCCSCCGLLLRLLIVMIQFPSIVFASFLYIKEKRSVRASASYSERRTWDLTILVPNESGFPTCSQLRLRRPWCKKLLFRATPGAKSGDATSDSRIHTHLTPPCPRKTRYHPEPISKLDQDAEMCMICLMIVSLTPRPFPRISGLCSLHTFTPKSGELISQH
jgi:hypothetical protein